MAPQSQALASEVLAMRRIEAAFEYAAQLPGSAQRRVHRWAREVYLDQPVSSEPENPAKEE